ncbi:MAG: hypothetical protein OER90_15535 [Gemmatimonadota bacterium]|nr:hypothetical protein [Gemmatimonadota bacterium]
MREYQVVIVRLQGASREDEEAVTDLLNERARMGWNHQSINPIGRGKLLLVFYRDA